MLVYSEGGDRVVYPAQRRYAKNKLVRAAVSFSRISEPELCEWLEGKDNKAGYIKGLIKADYEKHKEQEEN